MEMLSMTTTSFQIPLQVLPMSKQPLSSGFLASLRTEMMTCGNSVQTSAILTTHSHEDKKLESTTAEGFKLLFSGF